MEKHQFQSKSTIYKFSTKSCLNFPLDLSSLQLHYHFFKRAKEIKKKIVKSSTFIECKDRFYFYER